MKVDGSNIVALAALVANLGVTVTTLRHQRWSAHSGRLWEKRLKAYEEYMDYLVAEMQERHYLMSAKESPARPLPGQEDADRTRMLNRFHLYASTVVREAATDTNKADEEWRSSEYQHDQDPHAVPLSERVRRGFLADTMAERAMETIRREVASGRPRRLLLRKGAALELPRWAETLKRERYGER